MRGPGRLGQVGVNAGRGNVAMPEHQLHHFGLYTVFEQPCRMDVVEPIPAAWAAPAKVRLSVPRPTGLVAARVVNSQRGFLWVFHNRRRLESIGSGSGTSRSLLPLPIMRSSPLSLSMVPIVQNPHSGYQALFSVNKANWSRPLPRHRRRDLI